MVSWSAPKSGAATLARPCATHLVVLLVFCLQLRTDDGAELREELPPSLLRPVAPDDSDVVPLSERMPGDSVDCLWRDGWWQCYVTDTYDDHICLHFPGKVPFCVAFAPTGLAPGGIGRALRPFTTRPY